MQPLADWHRITQYPALANQRPEMTANQAGEKMPINS